MKRQRILKHSKVEIPLRFGEKFRPPPFLEPLVQTHSYASTMNVTVGVDHMVALWA